MKVLEIRPHAGPQERFLASTADIAIMGGAAGGGKTFSLCLECLYHKEVEGFGAVIFRRTSKQVRTEGGLWDRSIEIFKYVDAEPKESVLQWIFPSGVKVTFAHLEHEKDKYNWDGSQIAYIGFDELIHFSESMFFYMLSRNRSMCGVKPYVRATTNPSADSWVAKFISWWINQDTGYPIPERDGVLRWFYRVENTIKWYDTKEEAMLDNPSLALETEPKSVTFIAANIYDNPTLLKADPSYLANLQALPRVERERLLKGNWKIRAEGGTVFNRAWWKFVKSIPNEEKLTVRYWDKAATEGGGSQTAGVRMSKTMGNKFYIENIVKGNWSTFERERVIKNTAITDGFDVEIHLEQEPGSGGKDSALISIKNLAGYNAHAKISTGDKETRAMPLSAQVEAGNVFLVEGEWNEEFIEQCHNFPNSKLKDMVDASSGAFNILALEDFEGSWGDLNSILIRE